MINILKKASNIILDLIYPNKCMFCNEVININEDKWICKDCNTHISYVTKQNSNHFAVLNYDSLTQNAIYQFKYNNHPNFSIGFAEMLYLCFLNLEQKDIYNLVVNVPMHKKKKKKRTFDQAELLAKQFSKLANIPIEKDNLYRNKNTIAQSKFSLEERRLNVKGVFSVKNPNAFYGKNIILIDDIFTTGSTIYQCEQELKNSGANKIFFLTLARAGLESK